MLPDVSSELNTVNQTIQDTLHSTKLTTDETVIPVGKKTEAGEEILKEVSCFIEQKLAETLPEPPVSAPVKEKTPIKELVALTASSSQVFSKKTVEESGFDPEKTMFSYKKSEIGKSPRLKLRSQRWKMCCLSMSGKLTAKSI